MSRSTKIIRQLTEHKSGWLVFSDALSLRKARKLRIWYEFWDVLFAQYVYTLLSRRALIVSEIPTIDFQMRPNPTRRTAQFSLTINTAIRRHSFLDLGIRFVSATVKTPQFASMNLWIHTVRPLPLLST